VLEGEAGLSPGQPVPGLRGVPGAQPALGVRCLGGGSTVNSGDAESLLAPAPCKSVRRKPCKQVDSAERKAGDAGEPLPPSSWARHGTSHHIITSHLTRGGAFSSSRSEGSLHKPVQLRKAFTSTLLLNRNLQAEYDRLKQQHDHKGLSPLPSPPEMVPVSPQSPRDAELIAEAKLLRQHKGRLEARMQILEDHNKQLESQLHRLRQLLEQVSPRAFLLDLSRAIFQTGAEVLPVTTTDQEIVSVRG